jgi:Domain of unknown function (DUF4159)/Aerotolerance regulator N-terminal
MSLGALAFLNPWLLGALATLPIIYWLLRTVPPRPRQVTFPPTRILVGLENQEKTPAKSPWWLTLIRLLAATFIILALAEPVLNPSREAALDGKGPVAILVDNGWASAAHWSKRERMIDRVIAEAESHNRPVVVVPTASVVKAVTARIEAPAEARSTAAALKPQPFAPDRLAAVKALEAALEGAPKGSPSIVWLSDGIDHDGKAAETAQRLKTLADDGTFAVVAGGRGGEALGVFAGIGQNGKLEARVMRAGTTAPSGFVHAYSVRGQRLGETPFTLGATEPSATVSLELPLELRNQVARVEISGEHSAGAVSLLDPRSQWHRVALISGESREQAQPLLGPLYYIEKALAPFSELVKPKGSNLVAGIHDALAQNATVLVLADIGTLSGEAKKKVEDWLKRGGILVRFAGPRLENGGDELLPVPLRVGGRTLGGALSWSTPQPLGPIEDTSLFAGLPVPQEVTVNRQVLADPAMLGRDVDVWARLQDGTPLVTARKLGQGQIILFHVTANSDWSNLPLSGLFVEMLRRISALGGGVADEGEASAGDPSGTQAPETPSVLSPLQTLDGYGILKSPPPTAQPVSAAEVHEIAPSLDHPPGYYGAESSPRAINVLAANSKLTPLAFPAGVQRLSYESEGAKPLKSWLLLAALGLLLADIVAIILLQRGSGLAQRMRRVPAAAPIVAALVFALSTQPTSSPLKAQEIFPSDGAGVEVVSPKTPVSPTDQRAMDSTSKVTLGYVLTGNTEIDEVSRQGLDGLGRLLAVRTAVEPGQPVGVNVLTDDLVFYPVLYWPVLPDAEPLPEPTLAKIDAYMKQGGLIVFDTQDYGRGLPTGAPLGQGESALQRILGRLDVPRLEPVPENHVLTKAFYLLRNFPGRWDGGQLWVEAQDDNAGQDHVRRARVSDGVTSIIVTPNDFASAWALDERGRPLYPTVGGGEDQREMAFRTGINIVMHALTGNYKADQVHVPALLERLGQ